MQIAYLANFRWHLSVLQTHLKHKLSFKRIYLRPAKINLTHYDFTYAAHGCLNAHFYNAVCGVVKAVPEISSQSVIAT